MRQMSVRTGDGVDVAVYETGTPDGPEIILIHGFSQCHLSWSHQFAGPLARAFRIIAYDLRGHGASSKPTDARHYHDGRLWADELTAVLDALDVRRPVVVAWSYAGRIVADYLAAYGSARLAGINLVASKTRSDPAFAGPDNRGQQARMASADLAENIAGTIAFLRSCAECWDPHEFETHLAFNMLVPATVRRLLGGRQFDADRLYSALPIPVLFTHGTLDRVVPLAASEAGQAITPGAALSIYEGVGHAPFLEAPERFNAELAAFVDRCVGVSGSGSA